MCGGYYRVRLEVFLVPADPLAQMPGVTWQHPAVESH